MDALIEYLKNNVELDNGILLSHYGRIMGRRANASLLFSMRQSVRSRDAYIRYEIYKMLPSCEKENFTQELTPKGSASQPTQAIRERAADRGLSFGTAMEAGFFVSGNVQPATTVALEQASALLQEKARIYNQKSKLSNSLADFAENDNAGRKRVIDQIDALDAQLNTLARKMQGESDTESQYAWLKTATEKANMTDVEKLLYKKALTDRRGKLNAEIKKGNNIAANQAIIALIDKERESLG